MLQEGPNLLGNHPKLTVKYSIQTVKKFYFTCLFNAPAISNIDI